MDGEGLFVDYDQQLFEKAVGTDDVNVLGFGELPMLPAVESCMLAEDPDEAGIVIADFL
jgi:hypothetical protein